MIVLPTLIGYACFIFMIIGFFKPKASLFWMKDTTKRTRKRSIAIYLPAFILLEVLLVLFVPKDDNKLQETTNDMKQNLFYEKDIDLETGDTIYRTCILTQGGHIPYYSKGNIDPTAILTFEKCGKRIQASLFLTLGEFIKGDTIDVYFSGQNPEVQYTYKLKSNKEVVLNIPNAEAFMKKLNMRPYFLLHIPMPKQNGRMPFYATYNEGKVTFDKKNFE